jgi:hypothetical protein
LRLHWIHCLIASSPRLTLRDPQQSTQIRQSTCRQLVSGVAHTEDRFESTRLRFFSAICDRRRNVSHTFVSRSVEWNLQVGVEA